MWDAVVEDALNLKFKELELDHSSIQMCNCDNGTFTFKNFNPTLVVYGNSIDFGFQHKNEKVSCIIKESFYILQLKGEQEYLGTVEINDMYTCVLLYVLQLG